MKRVRTGRLRKRPKLMAVVRKVELNYRFGTHISSATFTTETGCKDLYLQIKPLFLT
jgi:hypothetical protein